MDRKANERHEPRSKAMQRQRDRLKAKKLTSSNVMVATSAHRPQSAGGSRRDLSLGGSDDEVAAVSLGTVATSAAASPILEIESLELGAEPAQVAPTTFAAKMADQGLDTYNPGSELRFEGLDGDVEEPDLAKTIASSLDEFILQHDFMSQPVPPDVRVFCQLTRRKTARKAEAQFVLELESQDGHGTVQRRPLLFASKTKRAKTTYFAIATEESDLQRDKYVAKLRANMLGTQFSLYDNGCGPSKATQLENKDRPLREELAAVAYETNMLGVKGPRKMEVHIPTLKHTHERNSVIPVVDDDGLLQRVKVKHTDQILSISNKKPSWNSKAHAYVLDFHGRVTEASVKNFILVHETNVDYEILQFGRTGQNTFSMDVQHPMSLVQAFGICLSSVEGKIGVE